MRFHTFSKNTSSGSAVTEKLFCDAGLLAKAWATHDVKKNQQNNYDSSLRGGSQLHENQPVKFYLYNVLLPLDVIPLHFLVREILHPVDQWRSFHDGHRGVKVEATLGILVRLCRNKMFFQRSIVLHSCSVLLVPQELFQEKNLAACLGSGRHPGWFLGLETDRSGSTPSLPTCKRQQTVGFGIINSTRVPPGTSWPLCQRYILEKQPLGIKAATGTRSQKIRGSCTYSFR